ncbi:Putative ribonuclease H protein At1g65750, partial [Linum perenne]
GWFSLNSDGSLCSNNHRAAAGGLIRDHIGWFISSFVTNLGSCSIMRAKLRGILEGMKMAWDLGIRKLIVKTYSRAAVTILTDLLHQRYKHSNLVDQFRSLRSRDWEISIHHIYRETNFPADFLANRGHNCELDTHICAVPDSNLLY